MHRLRSNFSTACLLGLFFLGLYLVTGSSDLYHNGDTDLRYQTTQAIVDQGHLWIGHPMWLDTRVAVGRGGHLYAFYAPGQTMMMLPLYVAGKAIAHHLNLPYSTTTLYAARSLDLFLGAALAVAFFLFALSAGYTRCVAVLLTLIFGMATVVWPDAQSALEQTPVDLFLLLAAIGTWNFVRGGLCNRRLIVLAACGAGAAVATRYDAAIFVPVFALYLAYFRWRTRSGRQLFLDLTAYFLALAPFALLLGVWDWARFGSPFLTGLHEQTFGGSYLVDLGGLLVSPGKGLLWYLPLVFLLPWTIRRFWRAVPALALLCAVLALAPILFYPAIKYWHGDPSWGPRYLYTAVPYLVLPIGQLLASWSAIRIPVRALLVVLVAAGLSLNVAALSVTQWRFWYRLEAAAQRTANAATWSGQPFHWGAQHYHYYWNVAQSPILVQVDDLYQVGRLALGDQRFRITARPDPYVSNPADNYPLNTFAFWWNDVRHPLLGARTRYGLAALLGLLSTVALGALLLLLREPRRLKRSVRSGRQLAQSVGT